MRIVLVVVIGLLALVSCGYVIFGLDGTRASADQPHECDAQAAHPKDPMRLAQGKSDEEIVGTLALRACTAAAAQFPEEPRFKFQLGRALAALNRTEEAARAFEEAALAGYAPATFYTAEEALRAYWSSNSAADLERAIRLLEVAEKSFPPAAERLGQVVCPREGFQNPVIVEALHGGDFQKLNRARILVALYARGMHDFLATELNPEDGDCPAFLVEPSVTYDLDAAIAGDPRNVIERYAYDLSITAASYGGKLLDPVWKGDPQRWADFYKALGRRDGQHLARACGCQSPFTKELYAGLVQFSREKRPLSEYAEELLNGEGRKLFLSPLEEDAGGQLAGQETSEERGEQPASR